MHTQYSDFLVELVQKDDRIYVMTAENRIFIKSVEKEIPHRLIDVGIAEQNMVGIAAGLSLRGKIPVLHCLAAFLTMRAFEFIRTDLGYLNRNVKLMGSFAGVLSEENGPTHQAIEDLSLMRGIPNMVVLAPSDIEELKSALKASIEYNGPTYIRFNNMPCHINHSSNFELGKGEIVTEGEDVTIVTYGPLLNEAVNAAEKLLERNISTRVINIRSVKPVDRKLIIQAATETKAIITLEDHFLTGGLTSVIAEIIALEQLKIPLIPITLIDKFFKPGKLDDIISYHKMDAENIVAKAEEFLRDNKENTL